MEHAPWLTLAYEQALQAQQAGEVPVGACVVRQGQCIAASYNQTCQMTDPTAHAEVLALRQAAKVCGTHRLTDAWLYVTLEPCAMCWGALMHARVAGVVFGARDSKHGTSQCLWPSNHRPLWVGPLDAQRCGDLLRDFFQARRA